MPVDREDIGDAKDLDAVPPLPTLFKHMVLAIFLENRLPRSRPSHSRNRIPVKSSPNKNAFDSTKFLASMDVALAQLKKYKMISETSTQEAIQLTAYGRQRDSVHRREGGSKTKIRRFDEYYTQLLNEGKRRVKRRSTDEKKQEETAPKKAASPKSPADDIFG